MSFNYIIKYTIITISLFIISCQDRINKLSNDNKLENTKDNIELITNDKLDLFIYENYEENIIDYYTYQYSSTDFLSDELKKIKINNFENSFKHHFAINPIIENSYLYSLNFKGEILKFSISNGKLIDRYIVNLPIENQDPISFSMLENDFIIGLRTGEVIRTSKVGEIIWIYKDSNLLNTPIKVESNNLIILYPEKFIILNPLNGKKIYEKKYNTSNTIQSTGGKLSTYFNFIYFILPNNEFSSIDTLLLEENNSKLNNIKTKNALNNLDDRIYIYKNLFTYLDNGNSLHTYDLINNKFILSNFIITDAQSSILYNNSIIVKNHKHIKFYNIKNGNLFLDINIEKLIKKKSVIIKVLTINDKLHVFFNDGKLLILNKNLLVEKIVDLKIKKIKNIFSYQDNIFISTSNGFTYLF